jgi:hypothetical protein
MRQQKIIFLSVAESAALNSALDSKNEEPPLFNPKIYCIQTLFLSSVNVKSKNIKDI